MLSKRPLAHSDESPSGLGNFPIQYLSPSLFDDDPDSVVPLDQPVRVEDRFKRSHAIRFLVSWPLSLGDLWEISAGTWISGGMEKEARAYAKTAVAEGRSCKLFAPQLGGWHWPPNRPLPGGRRAPLKGGVPTPIQRSSLSRPCTGDKVASSFLGLRLRPLLWIARIAAGHPIP